MSTCAGLSASFVTSETHTDPAGPPLEPRTIPQITCLDGQGGKINTEHLVSQPGEHLSFDNTDCDSFTIRCAAWDSTLEFYSLTRAV